MQQRVTEADKKAAAKQIKATWKKLQKNEVAFAESVMAFAKALLAGRELCSVRNDAKGRKGNIRFNKWLIEQRLDDIPKDDRSAYLNLARHEDQAMVMATLSITESRSVRLIWKGLKPKKEANGDGEQPKGSTPPQQSKGRSLAAQTTAVRQAAAEDDENEDDDEPPPRRGSAFELYFEVKVLPTTPKDVKTWLSKKADEIEAEDETNIRVERQW
jgi:hypothetical protein